MWIFQDHATMMLLLSENVNIHQVLFAAAAMKPIMTIDEPMNVYNNMHNVSSVLVVVLMKFFSSSIMDNTLVFMSFGLNED